ncbi:MAG: SprT-like domain-containing protein [Flavobacteriaceae bacterium]|nr:SprT-like domain-containing protein [Flavobacteriaceae bacterium]
MNNALQNYIPAASLPQINELLRQHSFTLKIVKQRITKHGDFRRLPDGNYQISLNNNLNKFQFLITLLHEMAHFIVFTNNPKSKPHGKEWKSTFKHLTLPFINPEVFPNELLPLIANYIKNPKASTDSDIKLALALKQCTKPIGKNYIFELPLGSLFYFKENIFKKGRKRRVRIECVELKSKRNYLFNPNVEVEVVKNIIK